MSSTNELPPRTDLGMNQGERVFRTALDVSNYLRLEKEAMSRGLRPYSLVKILITSYLNGGLIYLLELPEAIQDHIKQHQAMLSKAND
jgi:hypothetical protein